MKLGTCNVCSAATVRHDDGLCADDFAVLPKPIRQQLISARGKYRSHPKNALHRAYYAMVLGAATKAIHAVKEAKAKNQHPGDTDVASAR